MVSWKIVFGVVFVILSFAIMIGDAMINLDFKSKPSMVFAQSGMEQMDEMMSMEGSDGAMQMQESQVMSNEMDKEEHATDEAVSECFGHHVEDFEESLEHCQEDICGEDTHCFEEVAKVAEVMFK